MPTLPNPLSSNISVTRPQCNWRDRKIVTKTVTESMTLTPYHNNFMFGVDLATATGNVTFTLPVTSTDNTIGLLYHIYVTASESSPDMDVIFLHTGETAYYDIHYHNMHTVTSAATTKVFDNPAKGTHFVVRNNGANWYIEANIVTLEGTLDKLDVVTDDASTTTYTNAHHNGTTDLHLTASAEVTLDFSGVGAGFVHRLTNSVDGAGSDEIVTITPPSGTIIAWYAFTLGTAVAETKDLSAAVADQSLTITCPLPMDLLLYNDGTYFYITGNSVVATANVALV
jgi:hypothetical protein